MKIRRVGAELFCVERQTDGLTDMMKLKWLLAIIRKRLTFNQLMVYTEIITVYPQINTKHINTLCGQNVVLCCAHSVVIAILFNIVKHQISLLRCVSKRFMKLPFRRLC
jgi:hypothetical protein